MRHLASACPGSTVLPGLALRGTTAQHLPQETRQAVEAWLKQPKL